MIIISIGISAKILARVCAFVLSFFWTTRQKKRTSSYQIKSTTSVGGGKTNQLKIYRGCFIKGVNKYTTNIVSKIPIHRIRIFCYKIISGVKMEEKVVVYKGTVFLNGYRCSIGRGTVIGDDNLLDARGGLFIGENCNFSEGVRILTGQHSVQSTDFAYVSAPVIIGNRCWISGRATVLPGVQIGEGCVVAYGAVVTKDCQPFGIYAGIPAKRIGERNHDINYCFDGLHDWFL